MVDFEKAIKEARQAAQKEALDELFKHELGCTCSFCETCRSRFPAAPADNADDFANAGGEHQAYPFEAESTAYLGAIAKSLASVDKSLGVIAGAVSGLRDIFRGRDADNGVVQSPYRVLVDHLIGRKQAQPTGPATQRTPAQAAPAVAVAPVQAGQAVAAAPVQAPLFTQQKRVATDEEMQKLVAVMGKFTLKVRMDPKRWPKDPQKGRAILKMGADGGLMTEVDPEFLPLYADQLDWFASESAKKVATGTATDQEKKNATNDAMDAARCRRVAQLVQQGQVKWIAPAPVQTYSGGTGGDYD